MWGFIFMTICGDYTERLTGASQTRLCFDISTQGHVRRTAGLEHTLQE